MLNYMVESEVFHQFDVESSCKEDECNLINKVHYLSNK